MPHQQTLTQAMRGLGVGQDDLDALGVLATMVMEDKRATGKTIVALCSHDRCRPKTLKALIQFYRQTHSAEDLVPVMNRSLIAFAKNPHLHDRFGDIQKVVMHLRRNGADPLWKDEQGKDAVDYAYEGGSSRLLDTLLRFAWSNPIRKVRALKKHEQQRQDSRQHMRNLLQNIGDEFQTQAGFAQGRHYTPGMPVRQLNVSAPQGTRTASAGDLQNV